MLNIRKAAVIGAGTMGAQIAAHLANVGIPVLLMDIVLLMPEDQKRGLTLQSPQVRNRATQTLFDRAKKLSPSPLFTPEAAALVRIGNVVGKDTPGFVANRIGCFDMQHVLWLMIDEGLTIDEVDAITGPAIGRPKSATFRLSDIVGIDLMDQMGRNLQGLLKREEELKLFRHPGFIGEMVKRGWWGEKKGQGFYK